MDAALHAQGVVEEVVLETVEENAMELVVVLVVTDVLEAALEVIYSQFIDPKCFIDKSLQKNYEKNDYHKMYIGEIVKYIEKG